MIGYRREIDGLRAIAVIPVILFHAGFEYFSGGFVGVDVFFVISGYLITQIILSEKESGSFSLINFYERRARRILPSLFFMMAICIPLAWMLLLPNEMKDFAESLIAVSLLGSNFLFWQESGYFDTTAEFKPLLHTWSLAVEEQYYLLFPLLISLAWKLRKRWLVAFSAVIALFSLALANRWAYENPAAGFFLLPTRAWEIMVGALIGFYLSKEKEIEIKSSIRQALSFLGIVLIGCAIVLYDQTTPFPSYFALVPVFGTALVIIFSSPSTFVGKFLGTKLLVGIGLISYSAYLWHQPLFAFLRHASQGIPHPLLMLSMAGLSIFLAYLSWKYIETPFRNKARFNRKAIFTLAIVGNLFFISTGVLGVLTSGFKERMPTPPNVKWASLKERLDAEGEVCTPKGSPLYKGLKTCVFGRKDSDKNIVLYGDSHAQAVSRALDFEMDKLGYRVISVMAPGCGVIFNITAKPGPNPKELFEDCNQKFAQVKKLIKDNQASTLLVTRWTFNYFPLPGYVEELPFDNGVGGVEKDLSYRQNVAMNQDGTTSSTEEEKRTATTTLIRELAGASKVLYLSYPIPEIGWDIFKENVMHFQKTSSILDELSFPHSKYLERNRFILEILKDEEEVGTKFVSLRPDLIFCRNFSLGNCVAQWKGVPFYYDDDHLSFEGAHLLIQEFVSHLTLKP